ncbi:phage holin, lambda family [Pseudomonas linyingensis]|uniref:Phage holin, lambda family n=2 Tax=Pseudomonas linyingensis TaxID=915471 RepID=A0A1H6ZWN1_9PSED|nr:phage holin, lambda family [Pseudomonas linyingensis]
MKTMPEKDPALLAAALIMLRDHGFAGLLAFVLSWLRIRFDAKETDPARQLIEASLGGVLAFVIGLACEKLGLSGGWSYVAAGFVGTMGVNQVRSLAGKWAQRKVDG